MNEHDPHRTNEKSNDPLERAIAAVLAQPAPSTARQRVIDAAAAWTTEMVAPYASTGHQKRLPQSVRALVAIAAAFLIVAVPVVYLICLRDTANQAATSAKMNENMPSSDTARSNDVGRQPSPVVASSPNRANAFYAPVPMTGPVVADIAPIFVTIGPARPLRLGEKVSHKEIGSGLADDFVRLHIWDWSKSDRSRVMVVPKAHRGSALSPDGSLLLRGDGKAVNIVTGETRAHFKTATDASNEVNSPHSAGDSVGQAGFEMRSSEFNGFAVEEGQRVERLWFSPSGRYVAARIHVRTEKEQVQRVPPLFSTRHWWSLRVVELAKGKVVSEFATAGYAAPSFSPDETSIVYARPSEQAQHDDASARREIQHRDIVVRRDLRSGETICEYIPAYDPEESPPLIDADRIFESVGIAISPDGQFVAVGYYYGQLFIWNTASGKPISHHRFLRADRTRDTFVQASVMRFSPDGKLLATASGANLKILETQTGNVKAQHFDGAIPFYAHLRWSQDSQRITLLTRSTVGELAPDSDFPPKVTVDILPRVYEWDWKTGEPSLKKFR